MSGPEQRSRSSHESTAASERRRWRRAPAEWPVTVVLDDGPHEARVRDVSRAGICFFLDRAVPEMTRLRVELRIPVVGGLRNVAGEGVVVRSERISQALDHYEVAVFLNEMADPDRNTIEEFVRNGEADAPTAGDTDAD